MDNNKIASDTKFAIPYKNLLFVLAAPLLILAGFAVEIFAIMYKPKAK